MTSSPIYFTRGSSFNVTMKIPSNIEDGMFKDWTVKCQVRKLGNEMPSGFIAEVPVFWVDPVTTRVVGIKHDATDKWPVGEAEFDILFTSPKGEKLRSRRIQFTITRGVTQNG